MTKTKTDSIGVLILIIGTICSTGLLIWTMYEWTTSGQSIGFFQKVILTAISIIITPLLWTIEIPKLKTVKVEKDKVSFKNLLTGREKEILTKDFDGFKTTSQIARGGPVYEITLFIKDRPFHDISSNYIKNYDEIRSELDKNLENLGTEKFEIFKYLKERLRV